MKAATNIVVNGLSFSINMDNQGKEAAGKNGLP